MSNFRPLLVVGRGYFFIVALQNVTTVVSNLRDLNKFHPLQAVNCITIYRRQSEVYDIS